MTIKPGNVISHQRLLTKRLVFLYQRNSMLAGWNFLKRSADGDKHEEELEIAIHQK